MNEEILQIDKFNIISDEENYYFFRALNMADNSDIEQEKTVSSDGKIERIRTDRERYEGKAKYTEESNISLEEVYDHIKMHYRKDTNCISLTSNANIAVNYGRGSYKDKYVMIKIPKKEFEKQTIEAGKYMLQELYSKIEEAVEELPENLKSEILDVFSKIDVATNSQELQGIIEKKYTAKSEEINPSKAHLRKGIVYSSPKSRISSYQSLNNEQLLEVNKVYSKLAILENNNVLKHVIPHSSNSKLRETIGNAFSSVEVIHYGDIKQNEIIEVPKEVIDLFSLIQQIDGIGKDKVEEIKRELLIAVQDGREIPKIPEIDFSLKDNISIEEMYQLTGGTVEYGRAKSIVKNMFYLSKSRQDAIKLSETLRQVLEDNSKYEDVIEYIRENGFRIEPEIISRQSGKGVKLSESVNLNLTKDERILVDEIKKLSPEELNDVLENGGFLDIQDIVSKVYGNDKNEIDKSRYYAEAIIAKYNWQDIGIEEFKVAERNELVARLQGKNCEEIYERLKKSAIEENQIPKILLNIAMRGDFYEQYKQGNIEELLSTKRDILQDNINIELVERFLGYYDIENTEIRLKDYQQRACDNVDKIFKDNKFAQVILPTGAGKSFVALVQMQKYTSEHPDEKMLYLVPQDEILNQMKRYITKYIHGKQNTVGKTESEIITKVFPNITFETYSGLLAKRGEEITKEKYGMIVLDELHRTGAKEWEGKVNELLENQGEDVKVLGITATPTRDIDGRDMAEETAKKLGYTKEEVKQAKHIASNMTLENAIRMGYVVNPKLVYCKYDLIASGKMDELREKIDSIEDESGKVEELQKYNKLRKKLNEDIDKEIGEEARKKLEEEARRNLDSGIGKEEILRQNVKKGGKYIVFLPVSDQGDIEDEDGNRIGTKTGEDKILAYQEYLNKVFEGTEIVPQLHSLLGSYSKDKNKEELEAFESDSSEETKFMVVMNKLNEGIHVDGVDGIIWFRALDENSRILYLQQLGRAIYAIDEDNPVPDDKKPVVIDLVNNSLTVKIEKEFENSEPIDDLEALSIIIDWINEHNGMIPNKDSSNKQEQHYYVVLRKIQSKYSKYLEGLEEYAKLDEKEKERIQEIIDLASEIDLWDMDLPPIPKTRGSKNEFDPFTIEGILRNYVELESEVDNNITRNTLLKNALKIEKWCKEKYGEKEIYERKLPSSIAEDEEEKKLGKKLVGLRVKMKQYEGQKINDISNEEDRQILEIINKLDREYGLGESLKNALKIEAWCKEKYGEKEIYERKLPSIHSKDEEEKKLRIALNNLKRKMKQYKEQEITDILDEEDRKILEIINRLDREYGLGESLKNALKIEAWCKENYGEKEKYERKLPSTISKNEEEKKLGKALSSLRTKMKQYEGREITDILNEEDREILEIIDRLDREYGLGESLKNTLKIEAWCKEKYGEKEIYERRLPRTRAKDEEEKKFGTTLSTLRTKMKRYEGQEITDILNEEDREILEIIDRLDREYGLGESLKNALKIEAWCKEKYGEKEIYERRLPSATSKNEEEKKLGQTLYIIRKKMKKYEGQEITNILDEEDKQILEIINRLDREYGLGESLKNALKIEAWCKEKYGKKEIYERRLPRTNAKDEEEKKLGQALSSLRTKMKQYEGREITDILDEEDRQTFEIIDRLDREYNSRKIKLNNAKNSRDSAKSKNNQAKELEKQMAEQLKKRGKVHE